MDPAYRRTLEISDSMPIIMSVDIDVELEKLAARKPGEPNPFVDPDGFMKWLNQLLANAEKKLEDERKAGRP
jgi:hypothetical protein